MPRLEIKPQGPRSGQPICPASYGEELAEKQKKIKKIFKYVGESTKMNGTKRKEKKCKELPKT